MERFIYDYINDEAGEITLNELFCDGIEDAIAFLDSHFLEIHAERDTDISEVRRRASDDKVILSYATHFDGIRFED